MTRPDVIVIGAGMAGASLAAELAASMRVLILEAEPQPGYHSTGRSAAFWTETYGGPAIQPLTTASYGLLANPPSDFADAPLLARTGAVHLADAATEDRLDAMAAQFEGSAVALEPLDRPALERTVPGLREHWTRGLLEPSCANIDVAALHQAYLRKARASGAELICGAAVENISRQADCWSVAAGGRAFQARVLVNAAGAWADFIAAIAGLAPLGIEPLRRTLVQLEVDPSPPEFIPLVIDAAESFYFKREAGGRLWLSPHDECETAPCDAAPEELDVAIAIDRFERAVDWRIVRVEHKWAGLRSFAPDRLPVYGFDPRADGFFWFAGQGGFGIQTAAAAARLAAALITGERPHPSVAAIDPASYAPERLTSAAYR